MTTLDKVVIWNVWLANFSSHVRVIAAEDTSMDAITAAGKIAMVDVKCHEAGATTAAQQELWEGKVAQAAITKIERGPEAWLMPIPVRDPRRP